jgi:dihydroorotase-like cyclic amidohydrolase
MNTLIKNATLVNEGTIKKTDVLIEGEKIYKDTPPSLKQRESI